MPRKKNPPSPRLRRARRKIKKLPWKWIISLVIIFALGIGGGYLIFSKFSPQTPGLTEKQTPKNIYLEMKYLIKTLSTSIN